MFTNLPFSTLYFFSLQPSFCHVNSFSINNLIISFSRLLLNRYLKITQNFCKSEAWNKSQGAHVCNAASFEGLRALVQIISYTCQFLTVYFQSARITIWFFCNTNFSAEISYLCIYYDSLIFYAFKYVCNNFLWVFVH